MKIGIHEVQRELGRGGMGAVYAVTSPHLPRERALKLLTGGADPNGRARFRREAELLAQVRHPGVVAIHEIGEAEQGLYLVMDLVPGEPLDQVLRRGPATPDQARAWILEVADALSALHDRELLHRDLKPANVILRPDGHLVLLDFGLARSVGGSSLTETGGITGSPGFLAPEQARGLKDLTPAVDVHGLGTTLFSFLSGGVPPFRGATILATVAAVLKEEAQWPADLPPDLLAVGRKALAKDPGERFADAHAFAAALREPENLEPPPPPPKSAPLAILLGALFLIALLSGAWLATSSRQPTSTPSPSASLAPPTPQVAEWRPLPKTPGERALWFRETWVRWRAGEVPSPLVKREFKRLQSDPLYSLPVRSSEKAQATFWGQDRWVRQRANGVDWGQIGSYSVAVEVEGELSLDVGGSVVLLGGDSLTLFNIGLQPQAWRLAGPEEAAQLIPLPRPAFLRHTPLEGAAFSERRLCLFTATQAWELDLDRPDTFRLAYESSLAMLEEATYGPGDELVVGFSAATRAGVCLAEGGARTELDGVPKALAVHPLLPIVAVGDQNGRVRLWNYEENAPPARLREQGLTHRVRGLEFDPAGRFLYSIAGLTGDAAHTRDERGQVQVWRRDSQGAWSESRVMELRWTPDRLSLSPDGAWLLVSNRAGKVFLYAAGDRRGP